MKTRSVFEFSSYKPFMAHRLTAKGRRGQITRAAEALRCQRSYLSRVIAENLQLTPDHAFQLGRFWKLDDDSQRYFQLLVDFERAGNPDYRASLKHQLSELKSRHESVQERAARTEYSVNAMQARYFSTWVWSALHFLTSIPGFQTAEALSGRLGLRKDLVVRHLSELESQGFVSFVDGRWKYRAGEFHAPKDSPLVVLHHQNWRARAVQDAQDFQSDGVHFTAVQTVSAADWARIKELLLQFIAEASRIAGPSASEEGIALTCDVFRI